MIHELGGRKKSLCCQVSKALLPPLTCDITSCDIDPLLCSQDNSNVWGNFGTLFKRDSVLLTAGHGWPMMTTWKTAAGLFITQQSLPYTTNTVYMKNLRNDLAGLARCWGLIL